MARANPGGIGLLELALLGVGAWFLLRSPGPGQPSFFSSLLGSVASAPVVTPPATAPVEAARIVSLESPTVRAGADFSVQITVQNVGTTIWAPEHTVFFQQVQGTAGGEVIPILDPRRFGPGFPAFIPTAVSPGESVTVSLQVLGALVALTPGTHTFGVDVWTGAGGHQISPIALDPVTVI